MAFSLAVKIHPLVHMTIVDSYEKSFRKDGGNKNALGTLVGFRENGVIEVTDCYAVPFDFCGTESHGIDDAFNRKIWNSPKRFNSSETIVGWFFTVHRISERAQKIQKYFADLISEISANKHLPVLLLTLDASFETTIRLPLKSFIGHVTRVEDCDVYDFLPQHVELATFKGESFALDCIMKDECDVPPGDNDLDRLGESTKTMVASLKKLLKYVIQVQKLPALPADPTIGRKLMKVVNGALTQFEKENMKRLSKNTADKYVLVHQAAKMAKAQLSIQQEVLNMQISQ